MSSHEPTPEEEHIEFSCEHCGQNLTIQQEHAGQQVECPSCRKLVLVPGSVSEEAASGEDLTISCPKCGEKWREDTVVCVNCGTNLETGIDVNAGRRQKIMRKIRSMRMRLKSIPWILTLLFVILACYLSYRYSLGPMAMKPCRFYIENGTSKKYDVDVDRQDTSVSPNSRTSVEINIGMTTNIKIRAHELKEDGKRSLTDDFVVTCQPGFIYLYNIEGENIYYVTKTDYQEDGTPKRASFPNQAGIVVKALSDASVRGQLIEVLDQIGSFCQSTIEGKLRDKLIDLADYDYISSMGAASRKKTKGEGPVLKLSKGMLDIPIKEGHVKYYPGKDKPLACTFVCPKTTIQLAGDTPVIIPEGTRINLTRKGGQVLLNTVISKQTLNAFEHKIPGRWTVAVRNEKWENETKWVETWRFNGKYRDKEGKDWKVSAAYPVWCKVSVKRHPVVTKQAK